MRWPIVCTLSLFLLAGCGGSSPTSVPMMSLNARPMRVARPGDQTYGAGADTPAGTAFYVKVRAKAPDDEIRLHLCGPGCNTAQTRMVWTTGDFRAGDELRWQADVTGRYYVWSRNSRSSAASHVIEDEIVGNRLRVTLESGAVYEVWYVTP
jgi:hypothetical protein